MFKIQTAKYGYTWAKDNCSDPDEFEKLEDAIAACKDYDGDGKSHCRVIDENDKPVFTHALAYEGSVYVDHLDTDYKWIDTILSDHSLPKELILKGILTWLSKNITINYFGE